ncbi:oligosaccharide flippase family protein [Chloroflexota bacterium]
MSNTAVTYMLGFFFWMAVARFYSESEVGFGAAIISAINLLAIISLAGLNFSTIRFLSQADKPKKLINSSFTLSGLISLVTATVFIATVDFWSPALSFVKQNAVFFIVFVILAIFSTWSILMNSVFIARRSAGFVLTKNVILSSLKIPLVIALSIYFNTFGVVSSWVIALGIALAISVFFFLPKTEGGFRPVPTISFSVFKNVRQYSAGSYLASLLARAPMMILPLMVVNLLGTGSNAYFYISWMLASVIFTIPESVSRSLFAEGSHSAQNIKRNVTRSVKFTLLLLVPTVIFLMITGKWLLLFFGPGYSSNAQALLWLLILASLPRGMNNIYFGILRVQGRLKELVIIRGFIAVSLLTLSYLFMSVYGLIAIGYAWLGVQIFISIAIAFRLNSGASGYVGSEGDDWEEGNHF